MLEELSLKNIGGLNSASIQLSGRFIAITGESGAGKSSIVRGLEFIGGKRAQSELIKVGENEAEVQALFYCPASLKLPEDICPEEGNLFVKRIFSRNGRGKTFLQGKLVPLSTFSESVGALLRIQSQFAQLELLDSDRQRHILDSYGGKDIAQIQNNLRVIFTEALSKERELRDMESRQKEIIARYQHAEKILQSFRTLSPDADSEQIWEKGIENLTFLINSHGRLEQILAQITGGKTGEGIADTLENICLDIGQLPASYKEAGQEWQSEGNEALVHLQKMAQKIQGFLDSQPLPDLIEDREKTENKLGLLRKLKRLAQVDSIENLIAYCQEADDNLSWLAQSYERVEKVSNRARELRKEASRLAAELRKAREEAALSLGKAMNTSLASMAMEGITFSIEISDLGKIRSTGADEVSFLLASGDMPPGPVMKIASGGELSRLLLALQLSLPQEQIPETLIFDEVEAGLGGKAAVLAGYKLRELSEKCRVILITHEATIAALADQHFVVMRNGNESSIKEIDGEERVAEIARMLSGNATLPEAQEHARKLLSEELTSSSKNRKMHKLMYK
ncbi:MULTISPECIES: AAA family ATPase [Aminobacterium]|uniref:AAA family ATPase n=2 Tax=Aminobacteriaceae TaxID=3029087 RepID=UPI00257AC700|nr:MULTISPECIES: AAA family ATPase [unclassified Aminobacterium]